jgi:2-polyprenyl-3-methyl-5-hydroxy-6-metoxy-1,4-benzoquinol methylase
LSVDRVQKIANLYNDFNEAFLKWLPSKQFREIFDNSVMEIVEEKCKTQNTVRVLDLGCGHGTWISYLLSKTTMPGKLKIKGIDISEKRIQSAKKILADHPTVSLEIMDFTEMTDTEEFDIIFFAEVLQYVAKYDYSPLMQKCFQVLAKGGNIVIIDREKYSVTAIHRLLLQIMGKIGLASRIYQYTSYPSFRYLSKLSERIGLRITKKIRRKNFVSLVLKKP